MSTSAHPTMGVSSFSEAELTRCISDIRKPCYVIEDEAQRRIGLSTDSAFGDGITVRGQLPAIYPEWLGDRRFAEAHGCRFPYIVGEMARGVATPSMVIAAAKSGFLGFYGAAGLSV